MDATGQIGAFIGGVFVFLVIFMSVLSPILMIVFYCKWKALKKIVGASTDVALNPVAVSESRKVKIGKITGRVISDDPSSNKIIQTKAASISNEELTNLYAELAALEKFKGLADIDAEAVKIRKEADDYAKEKRAKAENIILDEAKAIAKKIISDAEEKAAAIVGSKTFIAKKPSKPMREKSPIFRARNIDTVTFDYINAKGEYSSRRVKVNMVGSWEFEGVDLSKRETRTFKFERVVGEIVSEVSGEIIDPETWAENLHL